MSAGGVSQGVSRGELGRAGDRGGGDGGRGRGAEALPLPRRAGGLSPEKMADRAEMFSLSTFHSLSPPGCRYALGTPGWQALPFLQPPT